MRSEICKILMWIVVVVSLFGMQNPLTAKTKKAVSSTGIKAQTLTLQVSNEDLYLSEDDILLVNIQGTPHKVTSLTRKGNRWIAQASPHGSCPWGHPLCAHCGLCHHRICPLFQHRCSASKCK